MVFLLILARFGTNGRFVSDEDKQNGHIEFIKDKFRKLFDISSDIRVLRGSQIRAQIVS